MHAIQLQHGKTFFVQGCAGSGKTLVENVLCFAACSQNISVLCVASSGIAALLLPCGRTAHSTLKIPIDLWHHSTCSISKCLLLAGTLKKVRLLIWDECSMQHCWAFEAVDRTLQDLRDNNSLFGGITCLLGGDFSQTLPVVTHGTKGDILSTCLLSSPLWPNILPDFLRLQKNMCVGNQPDEQAFAKWLMELAKGLLNDREDNVRIPNSLISPDLSALLLHTYPNIAYAQNMHYFRDRCCHVLSRTGHFP
jgi:hypothetical protein